MSDKEINEQLNEADALAKDILNLARDTLQVNMRFMSVALGQLQPESYSGTFGTDGSKLYYDIGYVLKKYSACRELPAHMYLHSILHCIFRHFYVLNIKDRYCWNLACDIAVENAIIEMGLPCVKTETEDHEKGALSKLKPKVKYMTAEYLYRLFLDQNIPEEQLVRYARLFAYDDHTLWYKKIESQRGSSLNTGDREISDTESEGQENRNETAAGNSQLILLKENWEDISKGIQTDMEMFPQHQVGKGIGTLPGDFLQELRAVNKERYDYAAFLKKFASRGEAMKINDEEFDYIFYTYGLKLYGKIPLIEPLEYKEFKKIRDFVIAIDTSGSVSGELVQKFVNKTYNILLQQENFFSKINLHIIECDVEIHEDIKITSSKDMEKYISEMELRGFGGTDFRPVFSYIDNLLQQGEFKNLKGMIYLTDGYGVFPEKKPDYQVTFVYVTDDINAPEVPSWAIKLVLEPDEIVEGFQDEH